MSGTPEANPELHIGYGGDAYHVRMSLPDRGLKGGVTPYDKNDYANRGALFNVAKFLNREMLTPATETLVYTHGHPGIFEVFTIGVSRKCRLWPFHTGLNVTFIRPATLEEVVLAVEAARRSFYTGMSEAYRATHRDFYKDGKARIAELIAQQQETSNRGRTVLLVAADG